MMSSTRFLDGQAHDPLSVARRSSLGVPASALIFPRSAADRSESNKLTRLMEEKYGFHYFTNAFCLAPLLEMDYRAYYNETNLLPACYAALAAWVCWLFVSITDVVGTSDSSSEVQRLSQLHLLIGMLVYFPVPILVACCRSERFRGHEQKLLCLVVHCFASAIMANGLIANSNVYTSFLMRDVQYLFGVAFGEAATNSTETLKLDGTTTWWDYENIEGSTHSVLLKYFEVVMLPIANLNINLLRPLIVLVLTPLFKLDAFHYILTALTVNFEFIMLVSLLYPNTKSMFFIANKFILIFCLAGVTVVLAFRVRQTDRFLRLNFLHARTVEERARASHLQKEIIINENKSLKQMLEERTRSSAGGPLDFDSPLAKVILDLKNLQRTAELTPELRENLDGIVLLLSKKAQNLFAPDIHEQLKQRREGDLDGDIKSWAATVLANKSYTRNRRASAVFTTPQGSPDGSVRDASNKSTASTSGTGKGNHSRFVEVVLHPDVSLPTDDLLNQVAEMLEKDAWSVDLFAIAAKTDNKPISFVTYIAFEQHNLFELCSVNKNTLANFLYFLDIGYHRNPYHNNCHAADVVTSVDFLISDMDSGYIRELLTYQEVFAALVAAAIHDFRHPGKNNNFMVKSGSDLAIEFSDSSVLERMHLAEAFFLAKDPLFNIFAGFAPSQYSEVRKAIVEMVLSTDLTVHLQLVGSLKTALISQDTSEVVQSPMFLMKIVIKCADLGHSSKAVKLHARWSDLIIEEFFLQGDDEHALGMDLSPFMNRNSENSAKNQVGFFEFIILPFFEAVAEAVFRPEFKMILDQAHQNYKLWKKAEALQLNSIKDILDQVFDLETSRAGSGSHHIVH